MTFFPKTIVSEKQETEQPTKARLFFCIFMYDLYQICFPNLI